MSDTLFRAACRCGKVRLEAVGPPIAHIICYCDDCQAAACKIDALDNGWSGQGKDGGTPSLLFRRDRVSIVEGAEKIIEISVRKRTPTRRLVASCCNTALTQIHDNGWPHSGIKTSLFIGPVPPPEFRIHIRYAPAPRQLPRDLPKYPSVPARLVFRLLKAKLALGREMKRERD